MPCIPSLQKRKAKTTGCNGCDVDSRQALCGSLLFLDRVQVKGVMEVMWTGARPCVGVLCFGQSPGQSILTRPRGSAVCFVRYVKKHTNAHMHTR